MWTTAGMVSVLGHSYGYPHVWIPCGYRPDVDMQATHFDVHNSGLFVDRPSLAVGLPHSSPVRPRAVHNNSPAWKWAIPHESPIPPHFPHDL